MDFLADAAPRAQRELLDACKGFVISQARSFLIGSGSGAGSKSGSQEDLVLAGLQGVLQAAYRFSTTVNSQLSGESASEGTLVGAPQTASSAAQGKEGIRFLTYAHAYIRKNIMAAIKESAYNQVGGDTSGTLPVTGGPISILAPFLSFPPKVFIPRRTLELRRSIESATSLFQLQLQPDGLEPVEPSAAAIAGFLGVSEMAVIAAREAFSTRISSLDPVVGEGGDTSEDVQMIKVLDRINKANVEASGSGSGALLVAEPCDSIASGRGDAGGAHRASMTLDGERFAAAEVASAALDALLGGIMTDREAWVLKKAKGLGR